VEVAVRPTSLGAWVLLLTLGLAPAAPRPASAAPAPVAVLDLDGAITPIAVRLLTTAIDRAQAERAQALVVQLNTPGGLERSMRSMAQAILASEVPVVVYVAPAGARAASAGVFITMAAHVAAMAPATNIGAAHPVPAGGGQMDKEMSRKIASDAAAFARSIAAERGRNTDWAEKAVRSSVSATEREAVRLKVVDLVAESLPDLLAKIDGRTLKTARGAVTLATREAPIVRIHVGFRDRFLALITDPNVAYVLMMVGMLGLFFELQNPGAIAPGVIGGICLILAFFAFQSLPINWAGLLLILFGIGLLVAEIKVLSHGVLTIGGVVAMVLGSLMLFDAPETGLRISWAVILPTVGATAGLVVLAVSYGIRALYRPPATGAEGMLGKLGVARGALAPEGQVQVEGEIWRALAQGPALAAGDRVRVTGVDGLTLTVVRAADGTPRDGSGPGEARPGAPGTAGEAASER
jgi:membrane-bound serine protease (ClpP class)